MVLFALRLDAKMDHVYVTSFKRLDLWSQRHTRKRGSLLTHESSCRHHWHPANNHLICHPTNNHRFRTQQAINGHSEWKFFLERRLCSHLKPGKYHSHSLPTMRTHFSALSLHPSVRRGHWPHLPAGHKGSINSGTLTAEMPEPQRPPPPFLRQPFITTNHEEVFCFVGSTFREVGGKLPNTKVQKMHFKCVEMLYQERNACITSQQNLVLLSWKRNFLNRGNDTYKSMLFLKKEKRFLLLYIHCTNIPDELQKRKIRTKSAGKIPLLQFI